MQVRKWIMCGVTIAICLPLVLWYNDYSAHAREQRVLKNGGYFKVCAIPQGHPKAITFVYEQEHASEASDAQMTPTPDGTYCGSFGVEYAKFSHVVISPSWKVDTVTINGTAVDGKEGKFFFFANVPGAHGVTVITATHP